MAGFDIKVEVHDQALQAALRQLVAAGGDLRPAMDEIGATVVAHTVLRFEQQRAPDGTPWRPLSAVTVLKRLGGKAKAFTKKGALRKAANRRLGMMKILIDSARLMRSITHQAGRDFARIGTNVVYGRIQQLGGQAGRGRKVTIPARPFLGLEEADRTDIVGILRRHLLPGTP